MKKASKRALALLLCVVMLLGVLPAAVDAAGASSGTCGEKVKWSLSKKGTLTISGTGPMGTYSWSEIPWHDRREDIKKVVIKKGVTTIGQFAFTDCTYLTDITIPNTVTSIGESAFETCISLKYIAIPDSVTVISKFAFYDCIGLETIQLSRGMTVIKDYTFEGCDGLKSITIPGNIKEIGVCAFTNCVSLVDVTLEEGVERIKMCAFSDTLALRSFTFPSTITTLGSYLFIRGNGMDEVIFLGDVPVYDGEGYGGDPLSGANCNIYYPSDNPTWTKKAREQFDRNQTWVPLEERISPPEIKISNDSSTGKPKLSWDASEDAQRYQIYRATSKYGEYMDLDITYNCEYVDHFAKAGVKYYYKVRILGLFNKNSVFSEIKSRTCNLPRPVVKESNVSSSGAIKLEWEKIEGAEKYKIYRRVGKSGDYEYYKTTSANKYTDKNTIPGTVYYYKVTAVHSNTSANSAKSSGVGQTCKLPRPVVEESNVSASGAIKLEWEKIEGAESYKIYRRVGKSGDYEYYTTTTSNKYTDSDTIPGTVYYYKVMAVHAKSSANSAQSSGVGQTCKLPRPVVEESNDISSGKIILEWAAIDGAQEYTIYRRVGKSGSYAYYAGTTENHYTDTDTIPGTAYYYKVVAVHANASANSAKSSGVGQTCDLAQPLVTAALNEVGQPQLTWAAIDGAESYKLYRSEDGTNWSPVETTTAVMLTDSTTEAGKTYCYKVKAIHSNSSASSEYSDAVSVTIPGITVPEEEREAEQQ